MHRVYWKSPRSGTDQPIHKTLLALSLALVLASLCGCSSAHRQTLKLAPPTVYYESSNRVVGEIIWVDQPANQAVIALLPGIISPGDYIMARDHHLQVTAIMTPSQIRRGRSLGVNIIEGTPHVGDTVVVPGSLQR